MIALACSLASANGPTERLRKLKQSQPRAVHPKRSATPPTPTRPRTCQRQNSNRAGYAAGRSRAAGEGGRARIAAANGCAWSGGDAKGVVSKRCVEALVFTAVVLLRQRRQTSQIFSIRDFERRRRRGKEMSGQGDGDGRAAPTAVPAPVAHCAAISN